MAGERDKKQKEMEARSTKLAAELKEAVSGGTYQLQICAHGFGARGCLQVPAVAGTDWRFVC